MTALRTCAFVACLCATAVADPPAPVAPAPTPDDQSEPSRDDITRDILDANSAKPNEVPADENEPITGTVRMGAYTDSDQTTVLRVLAVVGKTSGNWVFGASATIDSVTSASIDVRTSPKLSVVDTVTSASGNSSSSGGQMTDTRYQATGNAGWKDTSGHALTLTGAAATENDYASINGGVNGSYDILDRNATLLGGVTLTDNWVSSVIDTSIHRKMFAAGWSLGLARVITRDDAVRVRYDGKVDLGYNSSPYRNVRFGDWGTIVSTNQITFTNTIGSSDGLIEKTPETRQSNALVGEWVHSLWPGVGLHPTLRVSHDSWGVSSMTTGLDLRVAREDWRFETGYRLYLQSGAYFFQDKYTMDPSSYDYYTSDKELGRQVGHLGHIEIATKIAPPRGPNDTHLMLNLQLNVVRYEYPGFVLLPQRDSVFGLIGLSLER